MSDGVRIKRGKQATRRKPASGAGRRPRRALKKMSRIDKFLAALPVSEATLQRAASLAIVGLVGSVTIGAAMFMGLPAMAHQELAEAAGKAGFQVQRVEVRGVERMDEMRVYDIALGQVDRSMLAVDMDGIRGQLMQIGWVKDARISRKLPSTLVVDIVERQPVAVWQTGGQLHLIDEGGTVLEGVQTAAMPDLPLVIGPDANRQVHALASLMGHAPALKSMLAGATWVGNRRWDLRFQSGEVLALPEGEQESAKALVAFARIDGVDRLLGRGFLRFDMRDPTRLVARAPKDQPLVQDKAVRVEDGEKPAAPAKEG